MKPPFSIEQFLEVFQSYNLAIWPAQLVAYVLGIAAVVLALRKTPYGDCLISAVLAVFWLWMGGVYHLAFFTSINTAAYLFGAAFLMQGLLFLIFGCYKHRLSFRAARNGYGITGGLLILYAMLIYPLLGIFFGHAYPYAPMFGVAPCPATIFTFGLLLWTDKQVPKGLLIIPGLWTLVGSTATLFLGVREDAGLLVAGVVGIALLIQRDRKKRPAMTATTAVR